MPGENVTSKNETRESSKNVVSPEKRPADFERFQAKEGSPEPPPKHHKPDENPGASSTADKTGESEKPSRPTTDSLIHEWVGNAASINKAKEEKYAREATHE